ncbi:CehA/McbA family metallohydrolase [Nonomuraea angiospora]|uniref:Uncharacterized protein n=1 Tax=Nonomuraea angiospora TaxID=46172 RepID=A0ABR9MKG3_9ACTN|nr:CehA/McbA family metallohydrolase [Nonomuraea angiospora]MBE1593050.1 hypothetical protein [Nonomuraea angiospora]
MEYGEATVELEPGPREERLTELAPRRIYDAAARGWYGGDMHEHLNCAGDLVGGPADADVAFGPVDSLDVLTHASIPSTAAVYRRLIGARDRLAVTAGTDAVYRRLIGAGDRLAVTAGTDAMISFARSGNQSNPPGWARVYAQVEGALTARSFAAAVRAGRTFATTGPWLELSVAGHGPGHVLQAREGQRVRVTATAVGPEVAAVRIRTAECATSTPAR